MTSATKHNTNFKLRLAPSPADTRDQKFPVLRRRPTPNPDQGPGGWCWPPIAVCIDLDEAYGMLRAVGAILPASTKEDAAR